MKQFTKNNLPLYRFEIFDKYPEVVNLVSTRLGGVSTSDFAELNVGLHVGDNRETVLQNRKILADAINIPDTDITYGQQTHNSNVHIVTANEKGRGSVSLDDAFTDTDALVTNVPGIALAILVADCAVVSLYDPKNKAIGIVHSGRKGAEGEITIKTIEAMRDAFGTCAENLIAGISPCIYPCCYPADLPTLIKEQLITAGVKPQNIEESNICTFTNNDLFFSYRGDNRKTGRFVNVIVLKD